MRLAVIGTGDIGSGLAALFSRHGHALVLGTRDPSRPNPLAQELGLRPVSYRAAAESADLVCFCVPWEHSAGALGALGDLTGKILVDPSNPEAPDGRSLEVGHSVSGAEILAARAPGARVVKAFNYVYAELLRDPTALSQVAPSIFHCADDPAASRQVAELIRSCGLEPIDCGPLANARYLEPLALLMVQLVRNQGWPATAVGMRLAHRPA
jgi:predicted dinucleotide-binding enzyme